MNLATIDTNLLVALQALLQERSVTRAAKRVGIGQPAMSHALARLREHFDDPLLVPKGRELQLSPRAQVLVAPTESAMLALAEVFDVEHERRGLGKWRVFVLAATDLFASAVAPRATAELERLAPRTVLDVRPLIERSTEAILDGVDVALGTFADVPPTVNQLHLFSDTSVCVVRREHPRVQAALSLRTYLELSHLEVIPAPNARPSERIVRALGTKAHRRRVVLHVPYFEVAAHILARSDSILTVSRFAAEYLTTLEPLRIVDVPLKLPPTHFSMIWLRRHDGEQAHVWFRDLIAKVVMEHVGKRG